nr:dentin sialoprotein [Tanacetum cinerariifolium]
MSAKNNLVDKKEKNVDHYTCDEGSRNCTVDHGKDKKQESTDFGEDKEKRHDHGNKTVRWMNDEEKNLMDLGISEVERTKRLESLMERRRSKRVSNFQIIRNAMAMGINIPKKNPFLADSSRDAAPGSAPTCLVESNPFDLPYDPHEEKPILSGDNFDEEFVGAHKKELTLGRRESTGDIHETSYDRDFAIEQFLKLGSSIVANKKDDNKQPQQDGYIPNEITDNNHAKVEGGSSKKAVDVVDVLNETVGIKPAEKAVEVVDILDEAHSKELEVHHDVSSDQSISSYCSSDDEPILRPNKEAILHCLSMSRMRVASMGTNLRRNAESFDCGPSALFDKSKTDGFFFGANKRIHYGSTNSVASDMLVEVSELGSPSIDEDGIGSLVNSNNPSELDLNARLRDIDEVSENGRIDENLHESTLKQEKIDEQDARYRIGDERRMTHDHKDSCTKLEPESSIDQGSSSNLA